MRTNSRTTGGDQHRWHTAGRTSYTAVRAYWHDGKSARRKGVVAGSGKEGSTKTLKDTYATEADALQAAKAELQRTDRGAATLSLSLTLAVGRPQLMPQSPVTVQGFKPEIDGEGWLVKSVEHSLGDGGYSTQLECELLGSGDAQGAPENE